MTRDRMIEEALELARKYNDHIESNNLRFTKMKISLLEYQLENRTKRQVGVKSNEILNMFNHLKLQTR